MIKEIEKHNLLMLGEVRVFETTDKVNEKFFGKYFAFNKNLGYLGMGSQTKLDLTYNLNKTLTDMFEEPARKLFLQSNGEVSLLKVIKHYQKED